MTPATLDDDLAHALTTAATEAPSFGSSPSWRLHLDQTAETLHLHAQPRRTPAPSGADIRALHLSAGTALGNLQATAVRYDREPVVRLLPHSGRPDLLATVRLAGRPRAARLRRPDLHRALRHGPPGPSTASPSAPVEPVPAAVIAELAAAARLDGAELHHLSPGRRRTLRDGPDHERSASPATTDVLLTTANDRPADWLRAGRALQHVMLLLTLHGLGTELSLQPMEHRDLNARLADTLPGRRTPQILLRIADTQAHRLPPVRGGHPLPEEPNAVGAVLPVAT
ncbi:hypothetical protein ACFYNO_22780 [Kitasatospora sp. NPDC006697]|uniref:hypothetical protein n=1 Tax=Kitasatospora sp. NPDC006697 TaxID=3364020 RepID=UPI00368A3205